jgi:hypothetical protein
MPTNRTVVPGVVALAIVLVSAFPASLAATTPADEATQPATPGAPAAPSSPPASPVPDQSLVAGSPPTGRYLCYLVPSYTYSGWVELQEGGSYQAGYSQDQPTTDGAYAYDATEGLVRWEGGSYAETWPITHYVEPGRYPDGSERTGTGSDRHTLALKIAPTDPRLPGQEAAADPIFVYCYLQPVEG